jgi:hypothetical protein
LKYLKIALFLVCPSSIINLCYGSQGTISQAQQVQYNPYKPQQVGIGSIDLVTVGNIRYQLTFNGNQIDLLPGTNILNSIDGSKAGLLRQFNNLLIDPAKPNFLGTLLGKSGSLSLQPPDPSQNMTVTISVKQSVDDQNLIVTSNIYFVGYIPIAKQYYVLTFNNAWFAQLLDKSRGQTILETALRAQETQARAARPPNTALADQLKFYADALKQYNWYPNWYFINISFQPTGASVDSNPDIFHNIDITSIDIAYTYILKDGRPVMETATIPHDIIYKDPRLVSDALYTTLPKNIPGISNGSTISTSQN